MIDLFTNQKSSLAQNVFITCLNYGHWPNILCVQACYTRGISPSVLLVNNDILLLNMLKLRACTQLIIKRKEEFVCCLLQVIKVIHLDHSSTRVHPTPCYHIFIRISFPNGSIKPNPLRNKLLSSKEKEVK